MQYASSCKDRLETSGVWLRDARANLRDCDVTRDRDGNAGCFDVTDESDSRRPKSTLKGFTSAPSPLLCCSTAASLISDSSCKGEGEGECEMERESCKSVFVR